jgi:endonuclease G, mitochondrial
MKDKLLTLLILLASLSSLALLVAADRLVPTRPEAIYGYPTADAIEKIGYVHSTPLGHWGPLWTMEYLSPARMYGNVERSNSWLVDSDQPREFRWSDGDYVGSGWTRGHRAAAEDMSWSAKAMRESFLLTNTSPQAARLNEDGDKWAGLEKWILNRVEADKWQGPVATGTAWVPDENGRVTFETLGPGGRIFVGTHWWKAVAMQSPDGEMHVAAWLMPNADDVTKFDDYRVSTDQLEAVLGFDLWAGLPDKQEAVLEAML